MNKHLYTTVVILEIVIITTLVTWTIYQKRQAIISPANISALQTCYDQSPYKPENQFGCLIEDDQLYTLAGYRYVTTGDITSINFEHQPLTKYLYGLSTLAFGNPITVQILAGLALLATVSLLGFRLFKSWPLALVAPMLLAFDRLFQSQLTSAYSDLHQALWATLILLSLQAVKPKWIIIGALLGLLALSKTFTVGLIMGVLVVLFMIIKNVSLKNLIILPATALVVYLLGYLPYLVGHSLVDFAKLHLNTLRLYGSYVPEYPKGEIFRIMLTGKWRRWFGDFGLANVAEYTLMWPLSLVALLLSLPLVRKLSHPAWLILVWSSLYMAAIATRLVFPRYLLPALPALYLLIAWQIQNQARRFAKSGR